MGLFNRMKEPLFLKENDDAEKLLKQLRDLEPQLNPEGQIIIRQDIKCLEYGIIGEKNIAFELKNSHLPIYILHDIYLEDGELNAQIDYLVFTKKICFVIECKNLYGNIEITNNGDFIRSIDLGGKVKREGIYSPITQNQRHMELMKKLKTESKNNMLSKFVAGRYFEDFHKSVVVLANPKTVMNSKFASKEIKGKVIRADQLVTYIKDMYDKSKETAISDEKLLTWAKSFLVLHKNVERNYTAKYEPYRIGATVSDIEIKSQSYDEEKIIPIEETDIFKDLKAYRLEKSREEKIKPYYIYNDNQLKDLINKMPLCKEEMKKIAGFGEVKANKYGNDIFDILKKYYR